MTIVNHLMDTRRGEDVALFCGKPSRDRHFFNLSYVDFPKMFREPDYAFCVECVDYYRAHYREGTTKRLPDLRERFILPRDIAAELGVGHAKDPTHLYRGRTGKEMLCGATGVAPNCAHLSEFEEGAEYCAPCLVRFKSLTATETEVGFLVLASCPVVLGPREQTSFCLQPQVSLRAPYRLRFTSSDLEALRVTGLHFGWHTPCVGDGDTPAKLFHGDADLSALDPRLLLPLAGEDLSFEEQIVATVVNRGVCTMEVQLTVFARQNHFPKAWKTEAEMPSVAAHPVPELSSTPSDDLLAELLDIPENTPELQARKRAVFERIQQRKETRAVGLLEFAQRQQYDKLRDADREATRVYLETRESWHADLDPDDP